MQTFTDFKKGFYSRINDFSIFNCEDFNLLKVVLDGLKVDYIGKGKVKAYVFYPEVGWKIYRLLKSININKKELKKFESSTAHYRNKTILIYDPNRTVISDNNIISFYFENIIQDIGRENIIHVTSHSDKKNLPCDFTFSNLSNLLFFGNKLTCEQKQLKRSLLKSFQKIKQAKKFTKKELENIRFSIHKFFIEYIAWSNFLSFFPNITTAYFTCHYHKEGQILALKRHNINCIELQHGLIAPQDIFYVFPKTIENISKKVLFADKIYVYGNYWKNILLEGMEYSPHQIEISGYYPFEKKQKKISHDKNNASKYILITTQTYLHSYFIEFTEILEKKIKTNQLPYLILLKPHPNENPDIYRRAFKNSEIITIVTNSLEDIFDIAFINISIYSTTLYDAIRFGIKSYIFRIKPYEDYVNEIIKSGIASEITDIDDFLKSLNSPPSSSVEFNRFYANYNPTLFKQLI